jgi:hypothetical protein
LSCVGTAGRDFCETFVGIHIARASLSVKRRANEKKNMKIEERLKPSAAPSKTARTSSMASEAVTRGLNVSELEL